MARRKTQPVPPVAKVWQEDEIELLPGEQLYWQYRVGIKWSEPERFGDYHPPGWTEGLPSGRFWNGAGLQDKMFREEVSLEQIAADAKVWFLDYIYNEKPCVNWGNLEITPRFVRKETWCEGWFSHWTFDTFESDEQVLASFDAYVWRTILANERARNLGESERVLMGAEDRWRWYGWDGNGGPSSNRTPPPCRCEGCKKNGLVRINH